MIKIEPPYLENKVEKKKFFQKRPGLKSLIAYNETPPPILPGSFKYTMNEQDSLFDKSLTPLPIHCIYGFRFPDRTQIVNTPVYFVVNKFCEVIKTKPQESYFTPKESKTPGYHFFLAKQDAIDFVYKIAQNRPKYFKRMGLGINSIPLESYINKYAGPYSNLIGGTQEFENFIKKRKLAWENVYASPNAVPDLAFDRNKSLLVGYRIRYGSNRFEKPIPEPETTKIYLNLDDVMKDERVQKGFRIFVEAGLISESDLNSKF